MEKEPPAKRPSRRKKAASSEESGAPAGAKRSAASRGAASERPPQVDRDGRIAVAAYYRAEQRGFEPGRELDDWLAAEAEHDAGPPPAKPRRASSKPRKPPSRHTSPS